MILTVVTMFNLCQCINVYFISTVYGGGKRCVLGLLFTSHYENTPIEIY